MTTKLDDFTPRGIPIHPYDVYALLNSKLDCMANEGEASPPPEDEADYFRNTHKIGYNLVIDGKEYFQTCSVKPTTEVLV